MEKDTARKEWEKRKLMRGLAMIISEYCDKRIDHCLQENPNVRNSYVKNEYPELCPAWAEESPCPFYRQNLGTCILKQLPPEDWAHQLAFLAEYDKEPEA